MTIPVQTPRTTTPGNGSATVFNYSFKILDEDQLAAVVIAQDGTVTDGVTITNITGVGQNGGGTFTYNPGTPLPSTSTITAYLDIPIDQDEQITNQGNLYLSVIQSVLDTIVLQLQMVADQVARAPKLLADTTIGSVTMDLQPGGLLYVDPINPEQIKSTGNYGQLIGDLEAVLAIQDDIVGVNAISAEVVTVANNIADVNTVADNMAAILAAPQAANDAAAARDKAQEWADNPEDDEVEPGQYSAKHWAAKAALVATTGDYFVFSGTLTANQATGTDPIVLPADPKIAARVDLALGGIAQIAGTDFALDAAPNTTNLRIVGGTAALAGVAYGGRVQIPSSLTDINAPSAGSVVETTIQNGAVNLATKVSGNLPVTNLNGGTNANASTVWRGDGTWGAVGLQASANLPSTSGTSVVVTGVPATAKHISVLLSGVSASGTSPVQVNIGVGALQVTGYDSRVTSAAAGGTNSNTSNTGFPLHSTVNSRETSTLTGRVDLYKMSSTVWVCSATLHDISGTYSLTSSGTCVVAGNLDRVGIRATNGTDTFDGGSITVMWE